jgi:hypothetical protein
VKWRKVEEDDLFRLDPELARSLNSLGREKVKGEAEVHHFDLLRQTSPLLKRLIRKDVPPKRRWELREHIAEALVLLHRDWKEKREIDGLEVEFSEFVAVRLLFKIRELDQKANPRLYDAHRRYVPDEWQFPLDKQAPGGEEGEQGPSWHEFIGEGQLSDFFRERFQTETDPESLLTAPDPLDPLERLVHSMNAHGIAVASQAGVLRYLAGVWEGQVQNGRSSAKALGVGDYKAQPATQALLKAWKLIEEWEQEARRDPAPPFNVKPKPDFL